jgi:hypothetical protein
LGQSVLGRFPHRCPYLHLHSTDPQDAEAHNDADTQHMERQVQHMERVEQGLERIIKALERKD